MRFTGTSQRSVVSIALRFQGRKGVERAELHVFLPKTIELWEGDLMATLRGDGNDRGEVERWTTLIDAGVANLFYYGISEEDIRAFLEATITEARATREREEARDRLFAQFEHTDDTGLGYDQAA